MFLLPIHIPANARVSKLRFGGLNRYVVTGMRSTKEARIGDTLFHSRTIVEPLPGFLSALDLSVLLYLLLLVVE